MSLCLAVSKDVKVPYSIVSSGFAVEMCPHKIFPSTQSRRFYMITVRNSSFDTSSLCLIFGRRATVIRTLTRSCWCSSLENSLRGSFMFQPFPVNRFCARVRTLLPSTYVHFTVYHRNAAVTSLTLSWRELHFPEMKQ